MENFMRRATFAFVYLVLAACSSAPSAHSASAWLEFSDAGTASGLPGSIRAIDGRVVPGSPSSAQVPAGRRTISFSCPNTVALDEPPQVTADFVKNESYVLTCSTNSKATITRR